MEEKKCKCDCKKCSLIGLIFIFIFLFFAVGVGLLYVYVHNIDEAVSSSSIINKVDVFEEEKTINVEQYEKYKEFYDKYDKENMTWFIKDKLDSSDNTGAFTSKVKVYDEDYIILENGKLYYKPNPEELETYQKYRPEQIDENGLVEVKNLTRLERVDFERDIKYIIVPFEDPSYVLVLDEEGYPYINLNKMHRYGDGEVSSDELQVFCEYEFNRYFTDGEFNYNEPKKTQKILDVCLVEEEVEDYTDIYFMLEDGSLVNTLGEPYVELGSDFYNQYMNNARKDDIGPLHFKSLYYNEKTYIELNVDEDESCEIYHGKYNFVGIDDKIKKIDVNMEKGKLLDFFILTENGDVYSYVGFYMYPNTTFYQLYKVHENVVDIKDTEGSFVSVDSKGKEYDIAYGLYADGE